MKIVDSAKKRSKPTVNRIAELEREVSNLNMAVRVSQALLKQFMEQIRPMQDDLTRFYAILSDVQYKNIAIADLIPGFDKAELAKKADSLKLIDWEESSRKDDEANSLTHAYSVSSDDNIVIISSTTPDEPEDKGIFRSKTALKDIANQDIVTGLLGAEIGKIIETKINGSRHLVQLLVVRVKKHADQ